MQKKATGKIFQIFAISYTVYMCVCVCVLFFGDYWCFPIVVGKKLKKISRWKHSSLTLIHQRKRGMQVGNNQGEKLNQIFICFLYIFNFIKTVKNISYLSTLLPKTRTKANSSLVPLVLSKKNVNFMVKHGSHLLTLASYSFFCLSISCLRLATRLCSALWLVGPFVMANVSLLSLLLVPLLPRPPPTLVRCSLSSATSLMSSCTGPSNKGSSKLLPKKSCSGHVVVEERQEVEFSGREISQDEVDHVALSTLCLSSQLLLRLGCVVCC